MTARLVALLRGINVGGNKRVPMADLRDLIADLGNTDIATYVNSGNVVFSSASNDTARVAADIEAAVADRLGVESAVIVRTADEMASVIAADPLGRLASEPSQHLVGFCRDTPTADAAKRLSALAIAPDKCVLKGRELHIWCPRGVAGSRLFKAPLDRHLGTVMTARNWNTVVRLSEMAAGR